MGATTDSAKPQATNHQQTATLTSVTTSASLPFPANTLITHVQTRSIYFQLNPLFKSFSPIDSQPNTFNFTEVIPLLPFKIPPNAVAKGVIELEDKLDGVLAEMQSTGYLFGFALGETAARNRFVFEKEGEGANLTLKFEIVRCKKGAEKIIVKTVKSVHSEIVKRLVDIAVKERTKVVPVAGDAPAETEGAKVEATA